MSMSFKVQVIFYRMYGHVYKMAQAVVEGAKQVPGTEVSWYQVAELDSRRHVGKVWRESSESRVLQIAGRDCGPTGRRARDYLGHANALRQHSRAEAQFPRSDGTPVGQRDR
jgi:hypothetical protein